MNRQSKNAQRIAERLVGHPRLKRVLYPSLFEDAEQLRIRDSQTDYPGSLLSIVLNGGKSEAFDFLRNLRIGRNAVRLGRRRDPGLSSDDNNAQRAQSGRTGDSRHN